MNFKTILHTGDPLTIVDGERRYHTSVDDVADESNFSVLQPYDRGIPIHLDPGREYRFICLKSGGIHRFDAMAMMTENSGKLKVTYFRYTSGYIRLQRRNAFRCPMMLCVDIRKEKGDQTWKTYHTLDISETGMRVLLDVSFTVGDTIKVVFHINKFGMHTAVPPLTGKIVRTASLPNRNDEIICGVQFDEIDTKTRNLLLKLVTLGQRDHIRH